MARTRAGMELTRLHRQRQLVLRAATIRDMLVLSKLWNSPFDDFADATTTLVQSRRRDSAVLASDYYGAFRAAEGASGDFVPQLEMEAPRGKILASLFVTGLGSYNRGMAAGLTAEAAKRNALVGVSGSVGRHVLNAGRETILSTALADKHAKRWRRVTSGNPCRFCELIASRGAVFKEDTVHFQAHDHCSCVAEIEF